MKKHGNSTHGMTSSKEYRSWCHLKARCMNPNDEKYPQYGGRGITVCEEWAASFEAFYKDMGECPAGFSIDRINNDGNYEPSNCRWADNKTQSYNSRRPKFVEVLSDKLSSADAEKFLGLCQGSITQRVRDHNQTHQQAATHFFIKRIKRAIAS